MTHGYMYFWYQAIERNNGKILQVKKRLLVSVNNHGISMTDVNETWKTEDSDLMKWLENECFHWETQKRCQAFLNMSTGARTSLVREERRCFACLNHAHRMAKYSQKTRCSIDGCYSFHSNLLHFSRNSMRNNTPNQDEPSRKELLASFQGMKRASTMDAHQSEVSPDHKRHKLGDVNSRPSYRHQNQRPEELGHGNPNQARELRRKGPETGSNWSYCTESLANQLRITGKSVSISIATILKETKSVKAKEIDLKVNSIGMRRSRSINIPRILVIKDLPSSLEASVADIRAVAKWRHHQGTTLLHAPERVDLLIGLDVPQAPNTVRKKPLRLETRSEKQVRAYKYPSAYCNENPISVEDRRVLVLQSTSVARVDGHYQLPIPFRHEEPVKLAEQRLASLKKRLLKDPDLRQRYREEMQNLINKGHAERVPHHELTIVPGKTWYLPHHPVLNQNKPGKLRIVFDCAAMYESVSLNSQVMQGPDLNNKLVGVLLRFHQERVALMADIKAMFHQVRVLPEHRDALRFLWWTDDQLAGDPVTYRIKVVEPIISITREGGDSHSPIEAVDEERRVQTCKMDMQPQRGLQNSTTNGKSHGSERRIIAPSTIRAKIIFQDECRRGIGWDEQMTEHNRAAWQQWLNDLPHLSQVRIPRCYHPECANPITTVQLHHFCNASQQAYGAVYYLRITSGDRAHCTSFVCGRAKLPSLKQQTIPRLELCVAVLAAKADKQLREELELHIDRSVFWTDSTVTLQYIRNTERRFHTFVANRIATIHENSETEQWRHVSSNQIPADDASRGLHGAELNKDCR
ncbi:uncharacterized protein LOC121856861 [Homarus americanus]|uniref:uncharacterized protein LOC121856861 n=1 Tax=Homarus americanus TaxID=6706 RepID=UPI001C46F526|nr:uncharacterized protein LOC121856861 [Homarus americanus]